MYIYSCKRVHDCACSKLVCFFPTQVLPLTLTLWKRRPSERWGGRAHPWSWPCPMPLMYQRPARCWRMWTAWVQRPTLAASGTTACFQAGWWMFLLSLITPSWEVCFGIIWSLSSGPVVTTFSVCSFSPFVLFNFNLTFYLCPCRLLFPS